MNRRSSLSILALAFAPVFKGRATTAAEVSSLKPGDILGFEDQPDAVQKVLSYALELTTKNLGYRYGGAEISDGGMDCSGTIYHILRTKGFTGVPRPSNLQYVWVEKHGNLKRVKKVHTLDDPQLKQLKPGDLLFWEGTYNVGKRQPPTSHVMLYLGQRKSDGKPLMVGASSGRYYSGKARHGVSVFDFKVPRKGSKSKFVGYGPIPGLESEKTRRGLQLLLRGAE